VIHKSTIVNQNAQLYELWPTYIYREELQDQKSLGDCRDVLLNFDQETSFKWGRHVLGFDHPALEWLSQEFLRAAEAWKSLAGYPEGSWPLKVGASWMQSQHQDEHLSPHRHANAPLVGVCYLKMNRSAIPPKQNPLEMRGGDIGFLDSAGGPRMVSPLHREQFYISPQVGTLLIFPSHLWHYSVPFREDDSRLCVTALLFARPTSN